MRTLLLSLIDNSIARFTYTHEHTLTHSTHSLNLLTSIAGSIYLKCQFQEITNTTLSVLHVHVRFCFQKCSTIVRCSLVGIVCKRIDPSNFHNLDLKKLKNTNHRPLNEERDVEEEKERKKMYRNVLFKNVFCILVWKSNKTEKWN